VPALVIAAHRSEGAAENALLQAVIEAANDNAAIDVRTLHVGSLSDEAVVELMQTRSVAGELASALVREAHGSPFFVNELARALSRGRLYETAISTLRDALAAHVAELSPEAHRVLAVLSLAGQPLSPAVALEAASVNGDHALLDHLRDEHLLRVSSSGDGLRTIECYHDKVREVVSEGLDARLASELSLGLANALSSFESADPELLTRCLETAGLFERAGDQAARAAERAQHALAFDRAARLYEKALVLGRFEPAATQELRLGLADSLARAGHAVRAAEAYLAAHQHAPRDQLHVLAGRAGEQYMLVGQMDRGRELLAESLRTLGIYLPKSPAAAVASMIWHRARLRMRGLAFVECTSQDALTRSRLGALEAVTVSSVRNDSVRSPDVGARWLLLALESGHAVHVARALCWDYLHSALLHVEPSRLLQCERRAAALQEQTGDVVASNWLPFVRGTHQLLGDMLWSGDMHAVLREMDLAIRLGRAHPHPTFVYDEPWYHMWQSHALASLGRLSEARQEYPMRLEHAWARNDLTLVALWLRMLALVALTDTENDQVDRDCKRLRDAWRTEEVTLSELQLFIAGMMTAVRRGHAGQAFREHAALIDRLRGSFLLRMMSPVAGGWLGGLALAAARDLPAGSDEQRSALQMAQRVTSYMRSGRAVPCVRAHGKALQACAAGRRDGAIAALRELLAKKPTRPLYLQAARRRLGVLLADEEGRLLVAEADAFFTAAGVRDVARYVVAILPGLELT
jgi:tetratricopeptide (TPR) repeat protein